MPEHVFVIVVTFNGAKFIDACLKSVYESHCDVSVIVVDNNSSDDTVQIIQSKYPHARLIRNERNAGFGGANNTGINLALAEGGKFIFLLNQDTVVEPDAIPLLAAAMKDENSYAILSPIHLNDSGKDLDGGFAKYVSNSVTRDRLATLQQSKEHRILEVPFVNAAAWMISAESLKRVGGFAPLFFHYGEDRDFVNRMHFQRLKIGILTGSFIRHIREARHSHTAWGQAKLNKYYKTGWIARASNINRSLLDGWIDGFTWSIKEAIYYLLNGNVKVFIAFFISLVHLLILIPAITRHRTAVSSPTHFKFLSCE